jgi:hypothetical protein
MIEPRVPIVRVDAQRSDGAAGRGSDGMQRARARSRCWRGWMCGGRRIWSCLQRRLREQEADEVFVLHLDRRPVTPCTLCEDDDPRAVPYRKQLRGQRGQSESRADKMPLGRRNNDWRFRGQQALTAPVYTAPVQIEMLERTVYPSRRLPRGPCSHRGP